QDSSDPPPEVMRRTSRGKSSGPPGVSSAHTSSTRKSRVSSWIRQGRAVWAVFGSLIWSTSKWSASPPPRAAAFEHRLAGFPEVVGREAVDLLLHGAPEALLRAAVPRRVERPPGPPHRERRLGRQAA